MHRLGRLTGMKGRASLIIWRSSILILTFALGGLGCRSSSSERPHSPKWEVGQWVRYQTFSKEKNARSVGVTSSPTVEEFSIVGQENWNIKRSQRKKVTPSRQKILYWLEIYEEHLESSVIVKLLIPEGMKGKPERILIQNGSNRAVEVREIELLLDEIWKGMRSYTEFQYGGITGRKETLTLPAGELETFSYEVDIDEERIHLWTTEAIPIWGIAKLSTEEMEMVLIDYGHTGASSRIGEEAVVAQVKEEEEEEEKEGKN